MTALTSASLHTAGALLCALGLYAVLRRTAPHRRRLGVALMLEGAAAILAGGALHTSATGGQVGALLALLMMPLVLMGSAAGQAGDVTPDEGPRNVSDGKAAGVRDDGQASQ